MTDPNRTMETTPPPPPPAAPGAPAASEPGWGTYLLFAVASLWVILTTIPLHLFAWVADQFLLILTGQALPGWAWLLISWGHGALLALLVVPLAVFTRAPRFRAVYQTWALAVASVFVFGFARLFPMTWTQPAALAQIGLGLVFAVGLLTLARVRGRKVGLRVSALSPALGLASLVVLPSFLWGSLGSPTDTLLNLLAGLSLGLVAGVLLGVFLIQPLAAHRGAPGFGGFAAGVALLVLGAGFGYGGSQLLLMISLPSLGFAVLGLGRLARPAAGADPPWLPIAAFVGLAAAAPLMFVDPDEMSLLLGLPGGGELLDWALKAVWLSLMLGWMVGLGLWAIRKRLGRPTSQVSEAPRGGNPIFSLGGVAVTWLGAVLIYFFAGHPGFYGEQLFVILKDQADVSPAYSIADRDERLRYVYTTLAEHAQTTQAHLRATLDRLRVAYRPYYLVNAMEVDGGPILRAYLSLQPEVDRILDSPHLRPLPAPPPVGLAGSDAAPVEPPWNITSIRADRVWKDFGVTGAGIVVGESDTGVQGDHPALREGYRGRDGHDDYNWLDPWSGSHTPTDVQGHGTHTLGSILGRGGIGVAPGAEWIGCVNLARNLGNPPVYLNCMQFMLAPYPQGGDPFKDGDPARAAHVLNNSWGCPPLEGCDAEALDPAVRALRAAGIFVVASAGNTGGGGCGTVTDPIALYADVFTVGAVAQSGNVAEFSSRGPVRVDGSGRVKPDILAPGVAVLSSLPGSTYGEEDGTSMAGPHVVGVVALMWSANPKLIGDIDRTQQILIETARPYTGDRSVGCFEGGVPNDAFGYGLVDAYAAVKAALEEK